jgi:RNA polymerase sigma-70 factor (ECF subfamily)
MATPLPLEQADAQGLPPRVRSVSLVTPQGHRGPMPTSEELNGLAQAIAAHGDRQAFAVLFKHFAPRIKAFLMRSGCSPELAEEIAQEAMVNVWRKAGSFDPARAQLSTLIYTIARNVRVDHFRRHGAQQATATPEQPEMASQPQEEAAPPPEEQLDALRRERDVRRALSRLPLEQSQVLKLSFYDGQPHARIADELRLPLGTVKSRIRLAVAQLRRLLAEGAGS